MKEEFKAKIFKPSSGFDWKLNSSRLFFCGFLSIMILGLIAEILDLSQNIVRPSFSVLVIVIIASSWWGYHERQKKHGRLSGELRITNIYVTIDEIDYPWKRISNFSFKILQVLDEQLWDEYYPITRYYGGPAFSQGVDNYIDFCCEDKHYRIFFQLETPSQKVLLKNVLKEHYFDGNIELKPTYDGLGLEYEEIQELKREKIKWEENNAHNIP